MKKSSIILIICTVLVVIYFSCALASDDTPEPKETTTGVECKATDIFKDYDFNDVDSITVAMNTCCLPTMTYKVTDNDPEYMKQLIEVVYREDAVYTTSQFEINEEKNNYDFSLTFHFGEKDELTTYFFTANYVKVNGMVYYSEEMFEYDVVKYIYRSGQ